MDKSFFIGRHKVFQLNSSPVGHFINHGTVPVIYVQYFHCLTRNMHIVNRRTKETWEKKNVHSLRDKVGGGVRKQYGE